MPWPLRPRVSMRLRSLTAHVQRQCRLVGDTPSWPDAAQLVVIGMHALHASDRQGSGRSAGRRACTGANGVDPAACTALHRRVCLLMLAQFTVSAPVSRQASQLAGSLALLAYHRLYATMRSSSHQGCSKCVSGRPAYGSRVHLSCASCLVQGWG